VIHSVDKVLKRTLKKGDEEKRREHLREYDKKNKVEDIFLEDYILLIVNITGDL